MCNLGRLSTFVCALASTVLGGCGSQDEPCEYQEQELSPESATPWGTVIEADLATLLGPRDGVWTWAASTNNFDLDNANSAFPAQANLVVDPETYMLTQAVAGRGVACFDDEISAEGRLSFVDEGGTTFVDVPVKVSRTVGYLNYSATWQISPISDFSTELHPKNEFEQEFVRGLAWWSVDGEGLDVIFEYAAQTLEGEAGHGVISKVAEFHAAGGRP